jgi:hypothetical protein
MITLKPGINTEVVFTLNEKYDFYTPSVATYNDLYYYFRITNKLNGNKIDFALSSAVDIGNNRANKFHITVTQSATASANANRGWVNSGYNIWLYGQNNDFPSQWDYEVWGCKGPMPSGDIYFPVSGSNPPRLLEIGRVQFNPEG